MQYMQLSSSLFFHKKASKGAKIRNRYNQASHLTQDTRWNTVMLSISNNMKTLLKEFPHADLINMCYSREMCVTRVMFSAIGGNNQAQYMEIEFLYQTKSTYIDKTFTQINQFICLLELNKKIYH